MGRLCYPTQAPLQSCPGRPQSCPGARRVWRGFCHHGTKVGWALRVSRYNYERSQETITRVGL